MTKGHRIKNLKEKIFFLVCCVLIVAATICTVIIVQSRNHYDITKENDSDRYNTIKDKKIDLMLHYVINDETGEQDLTKITDYSTFVKNYLLSIGMSKTSLNQLIQNLRA